MMKVLKAGFYSTIQDQGRLGHRSYGVPVSGVMDAYSSEFANKLLGNNKEAAVLEMTMTGPELQCLKPTTIAITGAHMNPKLNGKVIEMFRSILVKPDDILSFGKLSNGFRTYVAVKGGFLSETVLGSRSMAKGITEAVRIQREDVLEFNLTGLLNPKHAKLKFNTSYLDDDVLAVTKGPEFDALTKAQQALLINQGFQVSKFNNRMAYQLLPLFNNNLKPILTAPVLPGTVQLTPSGQLIVLMRDCQTTGGYPRILQLTEQSINSLSQKTTGNHLKISLKD
ncbi:biotin-dependent carboxyltransferase family protein [Winogradskyella forsetii]|uniref:5-oxoprolinase subunit C family protein n=1 Tax=Winogradskyella forsetii TaxID=2686077 RepID=UPI0015BCD7F3|nr:biotin-dependent carboxyltransferase family protein [Winogradskyella forsetii]